MAMMTAKLDSRDPKSEFGMQATAAYIARILVRGNQMQRIAGYDAQGNEIVLTPEDRAQGKDYASLTFRCPVPEAFSKPADVLTWLEGAHADPSALKGFHIVSIN